MKHATTNRRCDTCAAWLLPTTTGPTCGRCVEAVAFEWTCFGYGDHIRCGARAVVVVSTHYEGDDGPSTRGVEYCVPCAAQCRRDTADQARAHPRGHPSRIVRSERVRDWLTTEVIG